MLNKGIKQIYNKLDSEEKRKFKDACYSGFSVDINGRMDGGKLISGEEGQLVWIIAGNLIHRKEYALALKVLNNGMSFATERTDKSQCHINFALAFEKLKNIEQCNFHCWKAISLGHSGSYAYERLIKNYVKYKEYEKAVEVCDLVLEREGIFNPSTWKSISEYASKRKEFILRQLEKRNK